MPQTFRRWLSILCYALVGALTAERLADLAREVIEWFFGGAFHVGSNAPTIFGGLIALLTVGWATAWFRPSTRQFRNAMRYPPGLLAVPIGFSAFFTVSDLSPSTPVELLACWAPIVFFAACVVIACALNQPSQLAVASGLATAPEGRRLGELTPEQFNAWLERQDAIADPSEDLFSANTKSSRVAASLREARDTSPGGKKRKALAVVGRLGVGKTSIIQMAERNITSDPKARILFSHTSGWGFDSAAKAQEAILDKCVERLTVEVDCNHLRRLPAHYRDAVNESDGWLKPLFVWAFGEMAPIAQLERFTPVLAALDAHLVVVVEDLDREDAQFDVSQVVAMLHHLRSVERVSFILAIGEQTPVELFKVADEVIFVEPLFPEECLAVVDRVRTPALQRQGFIDPEELRSKPWGNEKKRFRSLTLADHQAASATAIFLMEAGPIHNWPGDLGRLLASPRTLKGALRDFRAKWETLWGEVDPDELLILCALRHATPDIYQFAIEHSVDFKHLEDLRSAERDDSAERAESLLEKLRQRWEHVAGRTPHERDSAAALVAELFPGFAPVADHQLLSYERRIQSVRSARGPRYLRVIHEGQPVASGASEREALSVLNKLREEDAAVRARAIDALFAEETTAGICRDLEKDLQCVKQETRLEVLSRCLEMVRAKHGRQAWLMAVEMEPFRDWIPTAGDMDLVESWYVAELDRSLPEFPSLAASLIHFSATKPSLGSLGQRLREVVAKHWQGLSPEEWAEKFRGARTHALKFIVLPILSRPPKPTPELAWLPEKILIAMRRRPDAVLAEAVFCFKLDAENGPFFHEPSVAAFFSEREQDYYELLTAAPDGNPEGSRFWAPVRDAARAKLERLRNPPPATSPPPAAS